MKEIKIKMQIEYEGYYCSATNIYTYKNEDFINDLIKYYFRINDNDDGDMYFLILDKMEGSKSFEEFISYINGLKEGLEGVI